MNLEKSLYLPALPADHRLNQLLSHTFHREGRFLPLESASSLESSLETQALGLGQEQPLEAEPIFLNAGFFALENVSLFQSWKHSQQISFLQSASQQVLEESYFIEKIGITYAHLLFQHAESIEEQILYSLIGAEEAAHFYFLCPYLPPQDPQSFSRHPFLCLLQEILKTGDKYSLIFMIQVILEGWGLHHYQRLAQASSSPLLRSVFQKILHDEVKHHKSGMLYIRSHLASPSQKEYVFATLLQLLQKVQCGPQALVSLLEKATGGLTFSQRLLLFEELEHKGGTARKLQILRNLIQQSTLREFLERLEQEKAFEAFAPSICAHQAGGQGGGGRTLKGFYRFQIKNSTQERRRSCVFFMRC
jgi:hypothetical protein